MTNGLRRIAVEALFIVTGALVIIGLIATVGIPAGKQEPVPVAAASE